MKNNHFELGVLGFLLAITLMMAVITFENVKQPDFVSIESIKSMSCDELRANFNICRRDGSSDTLGYCADLYLPLYYERCK